MTKRIGIITFWWTQHNYGQMLQVYALQKYLETKGYDPFIIRYIGPVISADKKASLFDKLNISNISNFLTRKFNREKLIKNENRDFDTFRNKYLQLSDTIYLTEDEINRNPPIADVYICGSDQIWNDSFGRSLAPYLLSFGDPSTTRIAYAASFGKNIFSEEILELFKKHFLKFDAISVREEDGTIICKQAEYNDALWVPDPTLLLNRTEWLNLASKADTEKYKLDKRLYTFIYTLGNSNITDRKKFLSHFKPSSVHISSNTDLSGNIYPTVEEWVSLMEGSNFVLTNSFHGMVFSIILQKNFIILPNTGKQVGMNSRITSFLKKCGLEDHLMESYDITKVKSLQNKNINWTQVHSMLDIWIKDGEYFLLSNINDEQK